MEVEYGNEFEYITDVTISDKIPKKTERKVLGETVNVYQYGSVENTEQGKFEKAKEREYDKNRSKYQI